MRIVERHLYLDKYTEREDESFVYEIKPNYSVISLLDTNNFQGIPGLDLDLKKESYTRENVIPVFISERTPGKNREDLWDLLKDCNIQYLNQLEWLIRTDTKYSGRNVSFLIHKEVRELLHLPKKATIRVERKSR